MKKTVVLKRVKKYANIENIGPSGPDYGSQKNQGGQEQPGSERFDLNREIVRTTEGPQIRYMNPMRLLEPGGDQQVYSEAIHAGNAIYSINEKSKIQPQKTRPYSDEDALQPRSNREASIDDPSKIDEESLYQQEYGVYWDKEGEEHSFQEPTKKRQNIVPAIKSAIEVKRDMEIMNSYANALLEKFGIKFRDKTSIRVKGKDIPHLSEEGEEERDKARLEGLHPSGWHSLYEKLQIIHREIARRKTFAEEIRSYIETMLSGDNYDRLLLDEENAVSRTLHKFKVGATQAREILKRVMDYENYVGDLLSNLDEAGKELKDWSGNIMEQYEGTLRGQAFYHMKFDQNKENTNENPYVITIFRPNIRSTGLKECVDIIDSISMVLPGIRLSSLPYKEKLASSIYAKSVIVDIMRKEKGDLFSGVAKKIVLAIKDAKTSGGRSASIRLSRREINMLSELSSIMQELGSEYWLPLNITGNRARRQEVLIPQSDFRPMLDFIIGSNQYMKQFINKANDVARSLKKVFIISRIVGGPPENRAFMVYGIDYMNIPEEYDSVYGIYQAVQHLNEIKRRQQNQDPEEEEPDITDEHKEFIELMKNIGSAIRTFAKHRQNRGVSEVLMVPKLKILDENVI